jgi:hypothetical protein
VYAETYELPEVDIWDGTDPLKIGCTYGGSVEVRSTGSTAPILYAYDKCGMFLNMVFDGTGRFDPADGSFEFQGHAGNDALTFHEDSQGDRTVIGAWQGQPIDDHD